MVSAVRNRRTADYSMVARGMRCLLSGAFQGKERIGDHG